MNNGRYGLQGDECNGLDGVEWIEDAAGPRGFRATKSVFYIKPLRRAMRCGTFRRMTTTEILARVDRLCAALRELTIPQLEYIEGVVLQLRKPFLKIDRNLESDIVDERLLQDFGDVLRIHHCFSKEALSNKSLSSFLCAV